MKACNSKLIYFFILFLFFLSSCGEESIVEVGYIPDEIPEETPILKVLSYDVLSISNPNLHNSWETVDKIYLNGDRPGQYVDAPWSNASSHSISIPDSYRKDIKAEDGWKLLTHNMIEQDHNDSNYIIFYNSKIGILKGFYYNKTENPNNNLVWVMEANQPTSLFPTNQSFMNIFNTQHKYITTSNIVHNSSFTFGELAVGWNAFSFELAYGTTANNPIVDFYAYNAGQGTINLNGTYKGEVIIPITSSDPTGINSLVDMIHKASGGYTVTKNINSALTVGTALWGWSSIFTSKTNVTNIKATSSGTIELSGSVFTNQGGIAYPLRGVELKRINNNKNLGLWALKKNPSFKYNQYQEVYVAPTKFQNEGEFSISINLTPTDNLKDLIVINPEIMDEIESYSVSASEYFSQSTIYPYTCTKITDKLYKVGLYFSGITWYFPDEPQWKIYYSYILQHTINYQSRPDVILNVTFKYKDGSTFTSSRKCKIDNLTPINNKTEAESAAKRRGDRIIYFNY